MTTSHTPAGLRAAAVLAAVVADYSARHGVTPCIAPGSWYATWTAHDREIARRDAMTWTEIEAMTPGREDR